MSLLISYVGSWMQQVANSWLLLQLSNSAFLLGLLGLFTSLPFIAASMIGGTLADRVDRRKLLGFTQSAQITTAVIQGLLVQLGLIQIWHIYLFGALNWTIGGFDAAGRQALIPALVPRQYLPSAIALNAALRRGGQILGPALGGTTIALLGVSGAYWANAASFVPVVLAVALIRARPVTENTHRRSMAHSMLDGLRYAGGRPLIASLLGIEAISGIFANVNPLMAVFARDILHVGASGFGLLLSMVGSGALLGTAVLVASGSRLVHGRYIILATLLYPLVVIGFAFSRLYPLSLALLLGVGMLDMIGGTLRNTAVQLDVPDSYRGRIMGLLSIAGRGVSPLGGVQAGAVASVLTVPVALVVGALVTMGWSVATVVRAPAIRAFSEGRAEGELASSQAI